MKTKNKIALAKVAYHGVHLARGIVGLKDRCIVQRNGISFDLDLSEGIDFAIYLFGHFEPMTARALTRHVTPGSNVLDIGANIGAHTLHMARLVGSTGRVLAFEPTEFAYQKLLNNMQHNPTLAARICAYQCFLGRRDHERAPDAVYSSWPLSGQTDLHPQHRGQRKSAAAATSRTLDSILAEHGNPTVGLVKLDVDGFECDVLAGACEMIHRDRPTFIMELAPYVLRERGASLAELMSFFTPLDYQLLSEADDRPLSEPISIADGASINVVARAARPKP
jgi:FkbM family methyltransferase